MTDTPRIAQRRALAGLAGWLLAVFAAAAIGARASIAAQAFYAELLRPVWAPPGWVFGPVWTVLYVLMAVAAWIVWRDHGFRRARGALTLFMVQLVANALWTWLFFAWREGALAVIEIAILWVLIVATAAAFRRLGNRLAAWLLVPYLAWVTFAGCLAFAMWRLNPAVL